MRAVQCIPERTAKPVVRTRVLCWSLALCALAGCTTLKDVPTTHIVMVNGRGNPVDPTGNFFCGKPPCATGGETGRHLNLLVNDYPELERGSRPDPSEGTYEHYLDKLFDAMLNGTKEKEGRDKAPTKCEKSGPDGREVCKRRLLIFVHGGLNTQVGTVERAVQLVTKIPRDDHYPIFINWQSSLWSSYSNHLFDVRQGESPGWGPILSPFYFIYDVARAVTRAPVVWTFQTINTLRSANIITTPLQEETAGVAAQLRAEHRNSPSNAMPVAYEPKDQRGWGSSTLAFVSGAVTLPFKAVGSMLIDAFGKSAWDIMLRRTSMLYHTEREFLDSKAIVKEIRKDNQEPKPTSHIKPDGALSVFMRRLREEVDKSGGKDKWDITLIGHSMGTIVLNQMVRDFGSETVRKDDGTLEDRILPFNKIVFMGGAATVRDYQDSVFPYLYKNPAAEMYHLVLHPQAEVRERFDFKIPYFDPPPRGSLLVWVDDFLSAPETPLDRTVGRFENLIVAVHNTPDNLRHRVHIKSYGTGDDVNAPQEHSDFTTRFNFWKSQCWWTPDSILQTDCYSP
jgi:pimeloyl-ACP methyl ester carboxylesterase